MSDKEEKEEAIKRNELIQASRKLRAKNNLKSSPDRKNSETAEGSKVSLAIMTGKTREVVDGDEGDKKKKGVKKWKKRYLKEYADADQDFYKDFRLIYVNLPVAKDDYPSE